MTYRIVHESSIANATIRAHGIFASTVLTTNASVIWSRVNAALVDVDAFVVGTGRVTDGTLAIVATFTILADLTSTTLVSIVGALVDVDASATVHWIQDVAIFAKHLRDASVINQNLL